MPGALVRVESGHERNFVLECESDEAGVCELEGMHPGPIHLTARHDDRIAYARAFVPEETEVHLALEQAGVEEVQVVDAKTGEGIAGARVSVSSRFMVPSAFPGGPERGMRLEFQQLQSGPCDGEETDVDGKLRVTGMMPGTLYQVSVTAKGYAPFPARRAKKAPLGTETGPALIQLEPLSYDYVRWPIVEGELPPPPSGTVLQLEHAPGSSSRGAGGPPLPSARMQGTDLIIEDYYATGALLARADGAVAELRCKNGAEVGIETSFRRPRQVRVRVEDADGAPVRGVSIIARNQGNNDLVEWSESSESEGVVTLSGLYGDLADVYLRRPGSSGWGERIGSVDLSSGDAELETVLLPEPEPARARLTVLVNGTPRLPERFRFFSRLGVRVVEENAAVG
ncbi:MAG: carboxypeptidase-like regulatory domain-containing protein, partial [Planctomycetota bacterium]